MGASYLRRCCRALHPCFVLPGVPVVARDRESERAEVTSLRGWTPRLRQRSRDCGNADRTYSPMQVTSKRSTRQSGSSTPGKPALLRSSIDHVVVREWLKQAILLWFQTQPNESIEVGPFEIFDKVPLKHGFEKAEVRALPGAIARWGCSSRPVRS